MRLDSYLSEFGYAKSREAAQRLIREGAVMVNEKTAKKPSEQIDELSKPSIIVNDTLKYVSRGGLKLEHALDSFGVKVEGLDAVDIGASTGGFTDCLLQRGVRRVRCVDVGRSQLDKSLENDPRVSSFEGMNARYLLPEDIGGSCDIVVCDVSFISLTLILPAVRKILNDDGSFIALIKPQFEAGRAALDKRGIVKDRELHVEVIGSIISFAAEKALHCAALTASPIEGGDGNREYLALFNKIGGFDTKNIRRIVFDK